MHRYMNNGKTKRRIPKAWFIVSLLAWHSLTAAVLDYSGPVQPVQVTQSSDLIEYQVFDPVRGVVEGQDSLSGFIEPVQADGVLAWGDSTHVRMRTYDPSLGMWVKLDVEAMARPDLQTQDGVVTWGTSSRVHMAVYDQTRHEWRRRDLAPLAPPLNLTTTHGIVAWSSSSQFSTVVEYVAYNPVSGAWVDRSTQYNQVVSIQDLKTSGGVVAWSVVGTVYFRAFEPVSGSWEEAFSSDSGSVFDLVVGDGIAAWSQSSLVRAFIFDPTRHEWRGGAFPPSAFVSNLRISSGSVLWSGGGNSRSAGYNAGTGTWNLPLTAPRALFGVSTNAGNAPLDVYFFDQSLGASSWSWNFGDGTASSSRRSPYHRFQTFGSNAVTLSISTPTGGVFSVTNVILTDIEKPTGAVLINNGEAFTTNALVTLGLTAMDNSGTVASMRFSNDASSWSAWEPFAPSKQWIVGSAMGTNTVFAQFRDAAQNISDPVSDGIFVDTTPPPTISFGQQNYFFAEDTNTVAVAVRLSHAFGRTISVAVQSVESSATTGQDFEAVNQQLVFEPGQTNHIVDVTILDDEDIELNESFFLSFNNPTNGMAGAPATVTIVDDDLPSVSFGGSLFTVAEDVESGEAIITVVLSAPTGVMVEVDYETMAGTASHGSDYQNQTGHLVFPPGETERTFTVPILQDTEDEFPETVLLRLHNAVGAPLGSVPEAVLEILDEDPPVARFTSTTFTTRESAPDGAMITVELSSPFDEEVTLNYTLSSISAVAGGDYLNFTSPLRISPGQTNLEFSVNLLNDGAPENDETLRIRLTGFINATAGTPIETILTIEDDDRPRFHAARLTPEGHFETEIAVPFGISIQVQVTDSFNSWSTLTNIINSPSTNVVIHDSDAVILPRRFYRAIVP